MTEEIKEVAEETAAEAVAEEATEAPAEEKAEKKDDGAIEISFDDLGLTKSLEKMTAKELRALCLAKLPGITGATSMSKDELVATIKELFGMGDDDNAVSPYKDQILRTKKEIQELRTKKDATEGNKEREILRRKINKLKKRTRRLARAV